MVCPTHCSSRRPWLNLRAASAAVVPTFSFEKAGTAKPAGAEGHGLLPPESVFLGLVGREDLYSGNEAVVHGVHINVVHIEPASGRLGRLPMHPAGHAVAAGAHDIHGG